MESDTEKKTELERLLEISKMQPNDDNTCIDCGCEYEVRDGCDPSLLCDQCAQSAWEQLAAALNTFVSPAQRLSEGGTYIYWPYRADDLKPGAREFIGKEVTVRSVHSNCSDCYPRDQVVGHVEEFRLDALYGELLDAGDPRVSTIQFYRAVIESEANK